MTPPRVKRPSRPVADVGATDDDTMTIDAERLAGLAKAKLTALVRSSFPDISSAVEATGFAGGAGIVDQPRAFLYLLGSGPSPLGAALAWGPAKGADELHVIVDDPGVDLPRQLLGIAPPVSLWRAVGTELVAVEPASEPPTAAEVPDIVRAAAAPLDDADCDVVVEHGVITGEVLGLEVARVVIEHDGSAAVRIGVGLYDQEAHALMNRAGTLAERLGAVIDEVRAHRRDDVSLHPINRAARERWLRSIVLADPSLVGADSLEAVEPLSPRGGIHEGGAVAAVGRAGDDRVLVVTSSGVDLDLVPRAAGHLARDGADRIMLGLPARDHHPAVLAMAQRLAAPTTVLALEPAWPT